MQKTDRDIFLAKSCKLVVVVSISIKLDKFFCMMLLSIFNMWPNFKKTHNAFLVNFWLPWIFAWTPPQHHNTRSSSRIQHDVSKECQWTYLHHYLSLYCFWEWFVLGYLLHSVAGSMTSDLLFCSREHKTHPLFGAVHRTRMVGTAGLVCLCCDQKKIHNMYFYIIKSQQRESPTFGRFFAVIS